jgi:3-methyladenine DNA glycosylase/8-oxoguanine DNA glycosylase
MPSPWTDGHAFLLQDRHFAPLVKRVGPPDLRAPRGSVFASLTAAIVYQQLAGKAALTIHGRVVEALGGRVTPQAVLAADRETLRGAGLSRNKLAAILDLAEKATDGAVKLRGLSRLPDDAVVAHLTRVRGIGRWTSEMFLMFNLHRPDVWPVGDLGVRSGWARIHGLGEPLDAKAMEEVADHLRPWRSAAAWYCWRAVEVLTPRG